MYLQLQKRRKLGMKIENNIILKNIYYISDYFMVYSPFVGHLNTVCCSS